MGKREHELLRHVEAFVHHLVTALVNLEMHPGENQFVHDNIRILLDELTTIHALGQPFPLTLTVGHHDVCCAGSRLLGASLQARRLLDPCARCGIGEIAFSEGIENEELMQFLLLLGQARDIEPATPAGLRAAMRRGGIRHVQIEPAKERDRDSAKGIEAPRPALSDYQAMSDLLQSNHVAAHHGRELEVDRAKGVVEQVLKHIGDEPSALLTLAMYDDIDTFTVGHSVRVTLLALQVALATGSDRSNLLRVGTAALLHDIGKSRVPQDILFKCGPLEPDERREMAKHPRLGGEILLEQADIDPIALGAAFCHHMGQQGVGYPDPIFPFEPSHVSQLVRVCDVFEALTAVRPYKSALSPMHAYAIMHRMPGGFDPRWLHFFTRVIGLYPIGSRLALDTGEEAVVVGHGPGIHQPRVSVVSDGRGFGLATETAPPVTIGLEHEGIVPRIRAVIGTAANVLLPAEADAPGQGTPVPCCDPPPSED